MLKIYKVNVECNTLIFHGLCEKNVIIDKIWLSSNRSLDLGWFDICLIDYPILKGPAKWFMGGGMNLSLNMYEDIKIRIKTFVHGDEWFHGTNVKLHVADPDGKEIEVEHMPFYDVYVK